VGKYIFFTKNLRNICDQHLAWYIGGRTFTKYVSFSFNSTTLTDLIAMVQFTMSWSQHTQDSSCICIANPVLWSKIGVNLNYEGQWVENSRVLSLYGKKNYVGNVFYRRLAEHSYRNVKSSRKDFFLIWEQGRIWRVDNVHGLKRMVREGFKNVKLTTAKQWRKT